MKITRLGTFLKKKDNVLVINLLTYLLTYSLTYSMVQSPSWKANWFAAGQEIPRILWNPKVHYRTYKRPQPVYTLGQPNPVHIPTSNLWRSILIISTHLRLGFPSGLFPSGFPTKTLYAPPLLTHLVINVKINNHYQPKVCTHTAHIFLLHVWPLKWHLRLSLTGYDRKKTQAFRKPSTFMSETNVF